MTKIHRKKVTAARIFIKLQFKGTEEYFAVLKCITLSRVVWGPGEKQTIKKNSCLLMLTCLTCSSKSSSVYKLLLMSIPEGNSDSAESHSTKIGTQISCVYFFFSRFCKNFIFFPPFQCRKLLEEPEIFRSVTDAMCRMLTHVHAFESNLLWLATHTNKNFQAVLIWK